jgi:hypothetical protein
MGDQGLDMVPWWNMGFVAIVVVLIFLLLPHDHRHQAKVYKLKNHHIVMRDDGGRWWKCVLKGKDIDVDLPVNEKGEIGLPSDGAWVAASQQDEDEVATETVETEEITVDETDAGAPDGTGDVGGDSGGDAGDAGDGGND